MDFSSKTKLLERLVTGLFLLLTGFWLYMTLADKTADYGLTFGALYGLMALTGAIVGFTQAKKWGGRKSMLGLTVLFLAAGLAFAEFGQLVFSYYNIIEEVEIPYPSLADIGFFGNIPLYILGGIYLGRTVGVRLGIKKVGTMLIALIIPAIALYSAYHFFLKGYDFSATSGLQTFLDFGYPIGQALYISIAVFVLLASSTKLGGLMRNRILLVIAAFVAQFIADFNFLYQNTQGTWENGGYGDLLYLIAYFLMTLSLIRLCAPVVTESKSAKVEA